MTRMVWTNAWSGTTASTDRAQPGEPQPNPRSEKAAALQAALAGGTTVCLAAMVSPTGHALRVPHRKLSRHGPFGLHENHAEVFMRPVLTPHSWPSLRRTSALVTEWHNTVSTLTS